MCIDSGEDRDVAIPEHSPAYDMPFHLLFSVCVVSAQCGVFSVRLIAKRPQR